MDLSYIEFLHHGHFPTAWCFLVIVLLNNYQCKILSIVKTILSSSLCHPSSLFFGAQAGRKFYNLPAFFSFIRRIWHTPRGGIHNVVRDVSAKRLACQVVYSRFYTNLHKKFYFLTHIFSILKFSSLSCLYVSDRKQLIPVSRRSCLLLF